MSGKVAARAGRSVNLVVLASVITAALMLAGGTVWQLWLSDVWTGVEQKRATSELEENPSMVLPDGVTLAGLAAAAPPTVPASTVVPAVPVPPHAEPGRAMGRITAPAAGIDAAFVAGTATADLRIGPGWMAGTVFPGMPGNSVISGHRTTYGGPFRNLDALKVGDRIVVDANGFGTTTFEVRQVLVVAPRDVWVAQPSGGVRLTLTTCHPEGSDRQRLVVVAEAVDGPAAASATPAAAWVPSAPA